MAGVLSRHADRANTNAAWCHGGRCVPPCCPIQDMAARSGRHPHPPDKSGFVPAHRGYAVMKRAKGFEPSTSSLGSWHSATELRPHVSEINGPVWFSAGFAEQIKAG